MTRRTAQPDRPEPPGRLWLRIATGAALAAWATAGCAGLPLTASQEPARVLHPQVSRVSGTAELRPRHARQGRPLRGPLLLEPGDRIGTGPDGKVEILLPEAALRLYADTRIRVNFAFQGRTPACREVLLERGELLVRTRGDRPFTVRTGGLDVDAAGSASYLVAVRDDVHRAVVYGGEVEARNVRIRGQTVVRVARAQGATLEAGPGVVYLAPAGRGGWARWDDPAALTAGVAPPPGPREKP